MRKMFLVVLIILGSGIAQLSCQESDYIQTQKINKDIIIASENGQWIITFSNDSTIVTDALGVSIVRTQNLGNIDFALLFEYWEESTEVTLLDWHTGERLSAKFSDVSKNFSVVTQKSTYIIIFQNNDDGLLPSVFSEKLKLYIEINHDGTVTQHLDCTPKYFAFNIEELANTLTLKSDMLSQSQIGTVTEYLDRMNTFCLIERD